MSLEIYKKELIQMLCDRSVNFADADIYKLVSGRMSNFYVNCKTTVLHSRGAYLVGNLMISELFNAVVGVGGLETGAIPIVTAMAVVSEYDGNALEAFWVRKVQKDHGIAKWIEGPVKAGDKVTIVDDVATTGGSTIRAIERAREEGLEVVQAIILVDRQEGGLENILKHVDNVTAIVTRDELFSVYKKNK